MGSLRDEVLIPFRGIGGVGRALVAGSGVLCRCAGRAAKRGWSAVWSAATAGDALADRLESFAVVGFAVAVGGVVVALAGPPVGRLVVPYLPVVGWCGGAVWLVAAWVAAPASTPRKMIVSGGGVAAPPVPEQAAAPLDAWTVARTVHQIATPRGWKGAHLDDVLAHLPGRSRQELLAVLAGAEIPVVEQLKLMLPGGRQRNRQGVRLAALPGAWGEAPVGPVPPPAGGPAEAPPEPAPRPPSLTVHGGG